jgi:hypothetical protein
MNVLPLEARIRWNRLRVMGALVQVEHDLHVVEDRYRVARSAWRWTGPALAAAGLAWSLRARNGVRRGGRLVSLVLGVRSVMAMARSLRTAFFLPQR